MAKYMCKYTPVNANDTDLNTELEFEQDGNEKFQYSKNEERSLSVGSRQLNKLKSALGDARKRFVKSAKFDTVSVERADSSESEKDNDKLGEKKETKPETNEFVGKILNRVSSVCSELEAKIVDNFASKSSDREVEQQLI